MTRITREKGALAHDDRLDALALGIEYLRESMQLDSVKVEGEVLADFLEEHMMRPTVSATHIIEMSVGGVDVYSEDDEGYGTSFIEW